MNDDSNLKPVKKNYILVIITCLIRYLVCFMIAMLVMLLVVAAGFATEALPDIPGVLQAILMILIPFISGAFLSPLIMKFPFFITPAEYEAVYITGKHMLIAKTEHSKYGNTYYFYRISKVYQIKSKPFVWEVKGLAAGSQYKRPPGRLIERDELAKLADQKVLPATIMVGKIYGKRENMQIKAFFQQLI